MGGLGNPLGGLTSACGPEDGIRKADDPGKALDILGLGVGNSLGDLTGVFEPEGGIREVDGPRKALDILGLGMGNSLSGLTSMFGCGEAVGTRPSRIIGDLDATLNGPTGAFKRIGGVLYDTARLAVTARKSDTTSETPDMRGLDNFNIDFAGGFDGIGFFAIALEEATGLLGSSGPPCSLELIGA